MAEQHKYVCPQCQTLATFTDQDADYCAKRWERPDLDVHPRTNCGNCGASLRKTAVENYQARAVVREA